MGSRRDRSTHRSRGAWDVRRGMQMAFGMWLKRCVGILLAATAANAVAQMSVPPAYFPGTVAKKARPVVEMRLPAGSPARTITLAPPTAAEHAALKEASARSDQAGKPNKARRLAIGFARDLPASERSMRVADLPWQTLPDGTQSARVELTSPGAVAIRIELALEDPPEGLVLRFKGSAGGAPVFGHNAADTVARDGAFWTPVLEGETATVELELPASVQPGSAVLRMPMISHLGAPGANLKALSSYIGEAGTCEVDIACLAPAVQQQIATASNAVARLLVTVKGTTYLCSGTLLNDSLNSFTPYFLTANHCITGVNDLISDKGAAAAAASSINTYWFFQAATCGSQAMPKLRIDRGRSDASRARRRLRLVAAPAEQRAPARSDVRRVECSGSARPRHQRHRRSPSGGRSQEDHAGKRLRVLQLRGRQQLHPDAVDPRRDRGRQQWRGSVRSERGQWRVRTAWWPRGGLGDVRCVTGHRRVFAVRCCLPARSAVSRAERIESGEDGARHGILQRETG